MASIKGRHDKLTGFPSTINEEDDEEDDKAVSSSASQLQAVNGSAASSGPENGPGPPNVWKTAIMSEGGCSEIEKKSTNFVRHRGKRKQSFSGSVGPTSLGEEVIEDFNDEDHDGISAASVYRDAKQKPQALLEPVDYR